MRMETHVVVAGWGQVTQPKEAESPRDVPGLMIQAARRAGRTLTDPSMLSKLDGILVARPLSAHCPDAPARVARALGADPGFTHISDIGGNSPQTLINLAGAMIAENRLERILVVGAEAYVRRDPKSPRPDSALLQGIPPNYAGDDARGTLPLEPGTASSIPCRDFLCLKPRCGMLRDWIFPPIWKKSGPCGPVSAGWQPATRLPGAGLPGPLKKSSPPSQANRPVAFPYTNS